MSQPNFDNQLGSDVWGSEEVGAVEDDWGSDQPVFNAEEGTDAPWADAANTGDQGTLEWQTPASGSVEDDAAEVAANDGWSEGAGSDVEDVWVGASNTDTQDDKEWPSDHLDTSAVGEEDWREEKPTNVDAEVSVQPDSETNTEADGWPSENLTDNWGVNPGPAQNQEQADVWVGHQEEKTSQSNATRDAIALEPNKQEASNLSFPGPETIPPTTKIEADDGWSSDEEENSGSGKKKIKFVIRSSPLEEQTVGKLDGPDFGGISLGSPEISRSTSSGGRRSRRRDDGDNSRRGSDASVSSTSEVGNIESIQAGTSAGPTHTSMRKSAALNASSVGDNVLPRHKGGPSAPSSTSTKEVDQALSAYSRKQGFAASKSAELEDMEAELIKLKLSWAQVNADNDVLRMQNKDLRRQLEKASLTTDAHAEELFEENRRLKSEKESWMREHENIKSERKEWRRVRDELESEFAMTKLKLAEVQDELAIFKRTE